MEDNGMVDDQDEEEASSREMTPHPTITTTMNSKDDDDDNDADDDDEADPVIGEIPVFLSKGEDNDNLYLFQYPVRPAHLPYARESVRAARIKPRQKRIELVMGVDHSCPNYDKSKGRQIVLNAQGTDPSEEERHFSGGLMDKQTLSSTLAVDSTSRFAAGMLVRRKRKLAVTDEEEKGEEEDEESQLELHLTPLHGITQLRPSYEYLDRADVLQAKKEADGNSTEEEEEEEAQQVTVRFARGAVRGGANRGGGPARSTSAWRKMQRNLEEEPWITDIRWRSGLSFEELTERLSKARSSTNKNPTPEIDLNQPPEDYLKSLQPTGLEDKEKVAPAMPSNVLSLLELKDLSTSDALLALLTNAKVMRFSQILQLLPQTAAATTTQAEILRSLQQIAVLIRGNWVVKSNLLYPDKFCSRHSGVAASLLCRGRDYMLWKFTQSRNVIRKDIQSTTKLPADDILEMLNGVAAMRHGQGWNFRLENDQEFCNKYPDIFAKQNSFWEQKVKALVTQGLKINLHTSSVPDLQLKSRNRLNSEVSSSDDSDVDRRNSNSPRLPRSRKSSTNRHSSPASKSPQITRKVSTSKSKPQQSQSLSNTIRTLELQKDAEEPAEEVMEIEEITPRISNGVQPDEGSTSNGAENHSASKSGCNPDFLQFVTEKLGSEMTMKLSDFKRAFQYKLAESDPGSGLGKSGFNEKMVESAVSEAGAIRLKITWPKNSDFAEEPVFACWKKGDDMDQMRHELLRIFSETGRIQGKALRLRLEECWKKERDPETALPEEVFKQLKAEYCVAKSSNLYLRNTVTS